MHLTGTYKLQKTELQKEGFDVNKIDDPVFFMGPKVEAFSKLSPNLQRQRQRQRHKLLNEISAKYIIHDSPPFQDTTYRQLDSESYESLLGNLAFAKL